MISHKNILLDNGTMKTYNDISVVDTVYSNLTLYKYLLFSILVGRLLFG